MRKIYIITGAPASGKTTSGMILRTLLNNQGKSVIHLNEVPFIDTVVRLFDPEMVHIYKDTDGTLVFKDQQTLEHMNTFLFQYALTLHPEKEYIFEIGRGAHENTLASNYMGVFNKIPKEYLPNVVVITIVAKQALRWAREKQRRRDGKQYCPNISEYDINDIAQVKENFPALEFHTVENKGSTEELQTKLASIIDLT